MGSSPWAIPVALAIGVAGWYLFQRAWERQARHASPALAQAIAGHDSPAYQAALKTLGDGAVRDIRIVEGLE